MLLAQLGKGGMSRVYLATHDADPSQLLALKVLNRDLCQQGAARTAFRDEARLSQQFVHPNIVRSIGGGEVSGRLYMTMEHVPGWNLEAVVKELGLCAELPPEPVIAALSLQIVEALAYAHALRDADGRPLHVVHRDLKPGNVMLGRGGRVQVMDFGIARWAFREATTGAGWVKGTVPYMSPEQVLGDPLTGKSDVFALGSLMASCALGRPPFQEATLERSGRALVRADLAPFRERLERLLPDLYPVLARCLAADPERRPTAARVAADLRALAQEETSEVLARWIRKAESLLWPFPKAGSWPPGGPPRGICSARRATEEQEEGIQSWVGPPTKPTRTG